MNILVVGANGFLGRHLIRKAITQQLNVTGICHQYSEHIPKECQAISIQQIHTLSDTFDLVFLTIGNFTLSPQQLIETNITIPTAIHNKFPNAKLIFISSVSVYGTHLDTINEKSCFQNPTPYGLSKIAGEFIAKAHKRYSILRLTNLYGVGMQTKSFIPTIVHEALTKHTITLKGNGSRKNDYLYVEDAVDLALKAATSKSNEIYLGANGTSVSNREIAEIIKRNLKRSKIIFKGKETSPSYLFDPKETKCSLSWYPTQNMETRLNQLIDFYANESCK